MKVGDLVRRKRGGEGHGIVVGMSESSSEGQQILVRWSDATIFPNPTRERGDWLEVVRPAKERGRSLT
jgi:hypothetical protein